MAVHHALGISSKLCLTALVHRYCLKILTALLKVVGNLVLSHAVDTYLVVKSGHGSHLLIAVELCSTNPAFKLTTLLFVGMIKGIDEHECLLVRRDISTDSLTEHTCVAIYVEEVVLQLESQTYLLTESIQIVSILLRSTGKDGTNLECASKQYACLESDRKSVV